MPEPINFGTYNDMCTECEKHDECHKDKKIDYTKVEKCFNELTDFLEEQEE